MRTIQFFKYQGTGNDFVMLDNRTELYSNITQDQIALICNRKFGIGADGLIMIQLEQNFDFKMVYFNSDGRESSMCGNGGRCAVAFAHLMGLFDKKCKFSATDGVHEASIIEDIVALQMNVKGSIVSNELGYFINTGSPHLLVQVENPDLVDVKKIGAEYRNAKIFEPDGTNVNFFKINGNEVQMRTYERGVEDETLSCGTGVVAAALTARHLNPQITTSINVHTQGGLLRVNFDKVGEEYQNVILTAPATLVFEGKYILHD